MKNVKIALAVGVGLLLHDVVMGAFGWWLSYEKDKRTQDSHVYNRHDQSHRKDGNRRSARKIGFGEQD